MKFRSRLVLALLLLFGFAFSDSREFSNANAATTTPTTYQTVTTTHSTTTLQPVTKTTTVVTTMQPSVLINGSGLTATEKRQVPAFTGLFVTGPFEVKVNAQRDQAVKVKADDNLLSLIRTEVQGDALHIYALNGFVTEGPLKIYINTRMLNNIVATDRANIVANSLNVSKMNVDEFRGAVVTLNGSATDFTASLSEDSKLKASHLRTKNTSIRQSDTSQAEVYASNSLDLDVSGGSKLYYYGTPKNVQKNTVGTALIDTNLE